MELTIGQLIKIILVVAIVIVVVGGVYLFFKNNVFSFFKNLPGANNSEVFLSLIK